jgi:hypothetical protein
MHRKLTTTLLALLAVSVLMIFLAIISPKPENKAPLPKFDPNSSLLSLNKRNSSAKSVLCPSIRTGIGSNSMLFYSKDDRVTFASWFLGVSEALVRCDRSEYWFWVRSFDAKSIYFCDRERIEKTRLRPIMRPEVLGMIAWIGEIDPLQKTHRSDRGFIAQVKRGSMDIFIEFDHEKILAQSAFSEGRKIVTLEGFQFAEFSRLMMPKRIRATWHEENISGEFVIEKWIINAKEPEISPPEGLKRVSLEDYSSSARKSVSASFAPILVGR